MVIMFYKIIIISDSETTLAHIFRFTKTNNKKIPMKKLGFAFALFFFSQINFAQAWQGQGDQKFQVGFNGWGNGTGVTATYDYGIAKIISVGAGANFYFNDYKDDRKSFVFGRLNAHLQDVLDIPKQWDVYPGIDVGILGNTFGLGAHLGVRYFFNNNIGAFLEAGNNGSLGLSYNF
jgi:hypothetical protein